MTWNQVRWDALHELMVHKQIKVDDIDGGFEFNGFYMYNQNYKVDSLKSWWWVKGDKYRIGFGNNPGYNIIKEYNYLNWMPFYTAKIF